jgi:hypothetical protein
MRLILAILVCVMLTSGVFALMKHTTGGDPIRFSGTQHVAEPRATAPSLTSERVQRLLMSQ